MGIDTASDEFYTINTNQSGPPMSARHKLKPRLIRPNQNPSTFLKKQTRQEWTGPIYFPGHVHKCLSHETKDALQKYNVEAIQKFKSTRNLHDSNFVHDPHEHMHDNSPSFNEDGEFQHCQKIHSDCQKYAMGHST